jgi:hypothetical protein
MREGRGYASHLATTRWSDKNLGYSPFKKGEENQETREGEEVEGKKLESKNQSLLTRL